MIRLFNKETDEKEVAELLSKVLPSDLPHNEPLTSIKNKVDMNDGLFFVSLEDSKVAGCVMAGYDGHRGWIYSLAVLPEKRNKGIGSALLKFAEEELIKRKCLKLNLQVVSSNEKVLAFYKKLGFAVEERISMGKRLY